MIRPWLLSIATTIALACAPAALTHAAAPAVIPDITLTTLSGPPLHVADLKGKVVLLDFWASWCIPCRKSFPEVDALQRELKPRGLEVVAVNVDEQQKNADAFLAKYPHTMTVALDPRGNAARAFDLQAMPSTMIVDRAGRIRYTHQGYSEKTIGQFRSEVLQLLAETE
jgi:thiol-disulfide isomerase/thioredoxin